MPLPEFELSPYGYWIGLDRIIHPLASPQSHALHPTVAHLPGDELERCNAAHEAGWASISIFGDSFAIRTRKGAVPSPVLADIERVIRRHEPATISTDHHGSGETKAMMRALRRDVTYTVSSIAGRDPQYASPWEEIAHLREQLRDVTAERDTAMAIEPPSKAHKGLRTLMTRIQNLRAQYRLIRTNYKKSESISCDQSLTSDKKLDQLGYWVFHELNRNIWYCGKLLDGILCEIEDDGSAEYIED